MNVKIVINVKETTKDDIRDFVWMISTDFEKDSQSSSLWRRSMPKKNRKRQARCPICNEKMKLVETKQVSAKYECPTHGQFIVAFLEESNKGGPLREEVTYD